jgi:hypothetical protein
MTDTYITNATWAQSGLQIDLRMASTPGDELTTLFLDDIPLSGVGAIAPAGQMEIPAGAQVINAADWTSALKLLLSPAPGAAIVELYTETELDAFIETAKTKPGYIKEICKKCDLEIVTPIAPTPGAHNFVLVEAAHHCTAATVTNPLQIVGDTIYLGREYYKCSGCGLAINNKGGLVLVDPAATTTIKTWFDTLEDAEFYHHGMKTYNPATGEYDYSTLDIHKDLAKQDNLCVDSTCYTTGYDVYKCAKCNLFVYVTVAKKAHTNFKTVEAKDATCSKTGNIEYNVCNVCNDMFIIKDGKQVSVTVADITTNKHTHALVKYEVKDCTGAVVATYWRCENKKDNKLNCKTLWADEKATIPYTGITEAVSHKYTTIVAHVAPTCEIDETVGVYYCATCDTYKVVYTTVTYKF